MLRATPKYYHLTEGNSPCLFLHDRFAPGEKFPVHTHSEWELIYIIRGSGHLRLGDQQGRFSAGEVFFIPPDMVHGWEFDQAGIGPEQGVEDINLTFRRELPEQLAALFPELEPFGTLCKGQDKAFRIQGPLLGKLRTLLAAMTAMDSSERFGATMRIFHLLATPDGMAPAGNKLPLRKTEAKLQRIEAYVRLHYNRPISMAEIASLVQMNRSAVCIFFRRMTGRPFSAYLNAYRIETACRLLVTTDRSISEIADCVGFGCPAHFCRTFRREHGMAPSTYRRRHAESPIP